MYRLTTWNQFRKGKHPQSPEIVNGTFLIIGFVAATASASLLQPTPAPG